MAPAPPARALPRPPRGHVHDVCRHGRALEPERTPEHVTCDPQIRWSEVTCATGERRPAAGEPRGQEWACLWSASKTRCAFESLTFGSPGSPMSPLTTGMRRCSTNLFQA